MDIMVIAEGDPDTRDCYSGIAKSLVDGLRQRGHTVRTGDADLYGATRYWVAARTFRPRRRRWWVNYHLGGVPFRARSRNAERIIAAEGTLDLILQIGATFLPHARRGIPYAVFCDSNILEAAAATSTGYSDATFVTPSELAAVRERESLVYRGAAHIFSISERLRRSFLEGFGLPPERVTTVYAGPNVDDPGSQDRGPSKHPPTVLFVGREFERKGGDLLLKAFPRVRSRVPNARLVVLGPTLSPEPQEGVEFLGFLRKDVAAESRRIDEAYAEADVFCLPSRWEPFGVAYLEAMLHGLPCIGPDAWAVPEIIEHGRTGYLTPPEDPEALARYLTDLLADSDTARKMGAQGRSRVLEHFTWDRVVERMLRALDGIVQTVR